MNNNPYLFKVRRDGAEIDIPLSELSPRDILSLDGERPFLFTGVDVKGNLELIPTGIPRARKHTFNPEDLIPNEHGYATDKTATPDRNDRGFGGNYRERSFYGSGKWE
ncbi:MAG: hypothetical protein KC506_00360 [Nanoarchaeota archaeon]|nr:hypothetical protein [Nanoarchaeota archaeon]